LTGWLDAGELRVGLGCMRLGELADETIAAAAGAGVTVFDTARAYEGNEALLARALRACGAADRARIVTKGGMARAGDAWVPDGRAKAIRADSEASVAALDGLPIDLFLLHAPDPRTPWRTSLRALARLADEGLVRRVGVANVNRPQLDEALALAPIAAIQVALSAVDDRALRGGLVDRCAAAGVALIAHSPLGGPRRAGGLARRTDLVEVAEARGATPAEVALAWLLALDPCVVAVPGARRPETALSAARAATLALEPPRPARRARARTGAEVALVMGIPGAGKSRLAAEHVERGFVRLNREERGGSLRAIAAAVDDALGSGTRKVVVDNTYLTRADRGDVVAAAARHGASVRCLWLDTPVAQAQVNLVERLLDLHGSLPEPDELRALARRTPGVLAPTSQLRAVRELEPPEDDEGFASIEHIPFERAPWPGRPGAFVAAAALRAGWRGDSGVPTLVLDWSPDGDPAAFADEVSRLAPGADAALCPHPAGPPACWCRPPLPGLALAFARARGVSPSRSLLVGTGPAHRALAAVLGARYVQP
jgi:aryl-alcohol dehydrogenase-like predicted oxidoreductase